MYLSHLPVHITIKHRSTIRILCGRVYFWVKKFWQWYCSGTKFAQTVSNTRLPYELFSHKSLLRRQLKNVDQWMQENKIHNLKIAIQSLDGLVLKPGETFSYWRQIGNPTVEKGYLPGMVLKNGGFTAGVGGGLCQLSNLIYWMTLHTPLTVTERHRHSYDVFPDASRTQPFGTGATCSYPNIDLAMRNDTTIPFQLRLTLTDTHLVGQWFSTHPSGVRYVILEKNHHITQEWDGSYIRHNEIVRHSLDSTTGAHLGETLITENHAIMMYDPLISSH